MKYFGKSVEYDIEKYQGSGKVWQRHLKKHKVKPTHLWHSDWYHDTSIIRFATKFSNMNNIVESKKWGNLVIENGIDGGDTSKYIDYSKVNTPEAIEKKRQTISNPEWIKTTGKIKSDTIKRKYKERHSDSEWVENILLPSREHQSNTMKLLRKENPYETKICENCGKKTDPGNYKRWHGEKCGSKTTVTCPHCLKTGNGGIMHRWHFENCKMKR